MLFGELGGGAAPGCFAHPILDRTSRGDPGAIYGTPDNGTENISPGGVKHRYGKEHGKAFYDIYKYHHSRGNARLRGGVLHKVGYCQLLAGDI